MSERKLPSHIRIGRVEKAVQEIKQWMDAYKTAIDDLGMANVAADYSEGAYNGLRKALEIIEKNIFESRKTEG